MKPLLVLLGTYATGVLLTKLVTGTLDFIWPGRMAMSVMLLFTAGGHFAFTKGMAMMLPGFVPYKTAVIYLTGILEILAAAGLLIPATRVWTGWGLVLFFIVLLPANIKAAIQHVDYQKATFDSSGPRYLWFRVPLQVLFMVWCYVFAISFK